MKQWIKSALYVPKHAKPIDENILRMLLPSFLGIILCMVLLVGTTWAWFAAGVQTQPQTIEAGHYDISVVVDGESVTAPVSLKAGESYAVTLTADGTAPSGGYCVVEGGEKPLYTKQILPDETLEFTFIPENTADYSFTAVWGKHNGDGEIIGPKQTDDSAEPTEPPSGEEPAETGNVHIVQSGDTLWDIAKTYHTTVSELAAYNKLEEPDKLQIGQEIKIPVAASSAVSSDE